MIGRETEIERVIQILAAPHEEQPGPDRRARRGQDRHRRGAGPEDRQPRRAGRARAASGSSARPGRAGGRHQVPRPVRGAAQGGHEGDPRSRRTSILFIDELHTLVGAGAAEGAIDASNMLKPALSRGEIQCIGATTLDEYRKYIEKDGALERRFQPIIVRAPSVEETIEIIKGLRDKYEAHHRVKITDEAIDAAVKLADRYITDRYLPDKAIDVIDEAASPDAAHGA